MTRRELRENTFKMLFRKEFHTEEELETQFDLFVELIGEADEDGEFPEMDEECSVEIREKDRNYIYDRFKDVLSKIDEIDARIDAVAEGWKRSRMSKVDLSIIRLAQYEMVYDEDIPVGVAINEAVELAKKYGGDDSPSFVNGILAKLVQE